jgi:hypothetical protein
VEPTQLYQIDRCSHQLVSGESLGLRVRENNYLMDPTEYVSPEVGDKIHSPKHCVLSERRDNRYCCGIVIVLQGSYSIVQWMRYAWLICIIIPRKFQGTELHVLRILEISEI